jgi:hypothetical protein
MSNWFESVHLEAKRFRFHLEWVKETVDEYADVYQSQDLKYIRQKTESEVILNAFDLTRCNVSERASL